MKNCQKILNQLKEKGGRITPVRQALIEIFIKNKKPCSPHQLLEALQKKGLTVNKTTIYRQLEVLESNNIVNEVNFNDGIKRYELADCDHHHHLVCTQCQQIEDVVLPANMEPHQRMVKMISKDKKFKVTQHSLEFFGLCWQCQERASI